jgi:hypothetical protein
MGPMPRPRTRERSDTLSRSVTPCPLRSDMVSLVACEYRLDAGCGRPGLRQALTTYQMSHQPCPASLIGGLCRPAMHALGQTQHSIPNSHPSPKTTNW